MGISAGLGASTASKVICIGANVSDANVSSSCDIGSIAGQTVGAGESACYVDNDGKLDVFLFARRFERDVAGVGDVSEALLALRPVTFHYEPELHKTGIPQFGVIAEEVAKVSPEWVTCHAKGELSSVRYEAVNAMLLNEFLKKYRKVQEQEASIAQLKMEVENQEAAKAQQQKQIDPLPARLQKVSAQLETHKPAPQTVNNP